jgi:hypothetical protein
MPSLPRVHMGMHVVDWQSDDRPSGDGAAVPLATTWARAAGAAVPTARGGMLVLLAATRDKVSTGAAELDAVGAPEEPAPSAEALPGPELSSMVGRGYADAEAREVGAGP